MSYTYTSDDQEAIKLIRKAGLWGKLLQEIAGKNLAKNFFIVMVDKNIKRGKANYYLFFDGYDDPEENGYAAIIFEDIKINLQESLGEILTVEEKLRTSFKVAPKIINVNREETMH